MKSRILVRALALALAFGGLLAGAQTGAQPGQKIYATTDTSTTIGGEPVFRLQLPLAENPAKPQFVEAVFLPGRGMNLLQLKAFVPGKGVISLLASPPLNQAKAKLDGPDPYGNEAFKIGGAFLLPYPNRIRGTLSADHRRIEVNADGQKISLPANWKGDRPGAELHAMHGLILRAQFGKAQLYSLAGESGLTTGLNAGNFGGHWPSQTDVKIQARLRGDLLDLKVTAKNVGKERLPMAIGMHPYFAFPSGDRKQVRVHIPATMRAPATDYDDVFPLGKLVPVKGTRFDFGAEDGAPLSTGYFDDSFTALQRDAVGNVEVRVTDPAANYDHCYFQGNQGDPDVRSAHKELCRDRTPVQSLRSIRQESLGRAGHGCCFPEAWRIYDLARAVCNLRTEAGRDPA